MPLLDTTLLVELREALGPELAGLLRLYAQGLPAQVQQVQAAWEGGDREELKRIAHEIKGSSSSVGAHQLAALSGQIERSVDSGADLSTLAPVLQQLPDVAEQSLQAMRESGWLLP